MYANRVLTSFFNCSIWHSNLFSLNFLSFFNKLIEKGQEVERKEIRMPDGAIKKTGEYPISIHLGIDTDAIINLIVETNNQS